MKVRVPYAVYQAMLSQVKQQQRKIEIAEQRLIEMMAALESMEMEVSQRVRKGAPEDADASEQAAATDQQTAGERGPADEF